MEFFTGTWVWSAVYKTLSRYISCCIDSPFENLFSSFVLLVKTQFSYVWPKDLNEVCINLLKSFTFPSLKPKQFGSIAYVSGFKSQWHENFDEFHKTTCEFLSNPKAKITEFGDQQASKIRVRTKYFLTRCTRATNLRGLGTPAGMRAPRNFHSGGQLWGLGTLTKMLGSPKGSLKFSLEHSLDISFTSGSFASCNLFIILIRYRDVWIVFSKKVCHPKLKDRE